MIVGRGDFNRILTLHKELQATIYCWETKNQPLTGISLFYWLPNTGEGVSLETIYMYNRYLIYIRYYIYNIHINNIYIYTYI